MPRVYIIILNYKKWKDVIECLQSVFRSQYDHLCAIVIDNDSKNGSMESLLEWAGNNTALLKNPASGFRHYKNTELPGIDPASFPDLVFIENSSNAGFAGGNNVVLRCLLDQDAYIWLLNPDMMVREDTLSELMTFASQHEFKSIIGAVTKSYEQPAKLLFYGGGYVRSASATVGLIKTEEDLPKLEYISGGCLLTHTRHLREVGLLPEEYFLYWEETAWCYEARKLGYRMLVCPDAVCYDKISTSIGRGFLADYYYMRNGLLFLSKYERKKLPTALLLSSFRILIRVFTGRWKRASGIIAGISAYFKMARHENK